METTSAKSLKGDVSDGRYTSPRGLFSVEVPRHRHWSGVPYKIQEQTESKKGNYDLVAFYVKDFGKVLLAGVRWIPQVELDAMAKDDPKNVLKNLADKALFDWRQSTSRPTVWGRSVHFPEEPHVLEDSFDSTPHGEKGTPRGRC